MYKVMLDSKCISKSMNAPLCVRLSICQRLRLADANEVFQVIDENEIIQDWIERKADLEAAR